MKKCSMCGTSEKKVCFSKEFNKFLCVKCRKYEKEHPVNELPKKGEVAYDEKGRPICHICGRAFKKVASHAYLEHGINAYDYKEKFGLNNNTGLIAEETREKLREHVKENYKIVVEQNLIDKGRKNRYKKGNEGRTKDKLRLEGRKTLMLSLESANKVRKEMSKNG